MDDKLVLVNQMANDESGRKMRIALLAYKTDKSVMHEMIAEFRKCGILCWTEEQLLPGDVRLPAVARAYREADFILVLLSARSVEMESAYQARMKEAYEAARETPDGRIKIIPTRLNDCMVPYLLREYQPVDWWTETGPMRLVFSFATEWHRRISKNAWVEKNYQANWE